MQRLIDYSVFFLVRAVVCVIQSVRIETCASVCRVLAYLFNDVLGIRRAVIDDNLRQTFPQYSAEQRRRVVREMWNHLLLMVCEVAHVPRKIHHTNWRDHIVIRNKVQLAEYLMDTRPNLVVSGHFGNFEAAGWFLGLLGFPSFTIARALDNPYLNRFVCRFRGAQGQFILPKDGSGKAVEAILASGGIISMLGDQHAGRRGCWVDFLGRPASCHKALALFTLTAKAPMIVSYGRRGGRPMQFEVGMAAVADPARPDRHQDNVKTLTQWYNDRLGELILAHPQQYWWLHRRWKGKPERRAKPRKAA